MKYIKRYLLPLATCTAILSAAHIARAATVVWNGASGIGLNWSTPGNWLGGVAPGSADDVRFFDDGADATPLNVNNTVNGLFGGRILSLQYGQSNLLYHTTQIDAGQTLTVLGSLIVGTEAIAGQNVEAAIMGTGTLVVSNPAVDMIVRQGGDGTSRRATLDLSGLDTFILDVDQVVIGRADPPGLLNVNRNTGWVYLAKTNRIRSASTAATSSAIGIEVGRSGSNNGNGSRLYLGQTNGIFASSLSVGMEKETGCQLLFNSIFTEPSAYIRGSDGSSRMNLWAIGDGEANSGTTSCQGTADFTGGTVDALVDVMTLGRASANAGGTGNSRGTLTFSAGTINVNTLRVGQQTISSGKNGNGVVNVNGGALIVNSSMELGIATGGAGVATTMGQLNINGGTVTAKLITAGTITGGSSINVTSGTLAIGTTAGSVGSPMGSLSLSDSTLQLGTVDVTPRVVVTNLTTGGAGNTISVGLLPSITSYPVQFKLIDYSGSIAGSDYNFTLSGLSVNYTGFLSNNTVEGSVDLVLTAGPVAQNITWNGDLSDDWDNLTTKNWLIGGISTNYFDGDFVTFNDTAAGATTVDLTTVLLPGSVTVNNSTLSYTFTGSGAVGGLSGLTKQGSGSLVLLNAGANSFAGGVSIGAGTLQVGNGGTTGNLGSGALNNDGALVFNRSDDVTVGNAIAGSASGSLTKSGAGVLTLSGANTFTGAVNVVQGTVKAGNASALGRTDGNTVINNGATLDVNDLNMGLEPVIVSGAGVGGLGAIVENTGSAAFNQANLAFVTLAGDTTFGGTGRWDLRASNTGDPSLAALSTGGQPYKLTKVGPNGVYLPGVTVDPALGDVDVVEGTLAIESATTGLGNPASNVVVRAGATLQLFNLTNLLNKVITLNGSGTNNTVNAADGIASLNFVVGPMSLNGECWMNVNVSDFMTLSNALSGSGSLVKVGGGTLTLSGPAKNYGGNTTVSNGTLVLNCSLNGSGTLTTLTGTALGGTGTNTGPVIVGGTLSPGTSAGTFGSGNLTLEAGATLQFELNSVTTIGNGVNDLINVAGDLTVNNNSININLLATALQAGTYRLINYTGNLTGTFDPTITLAGGASHYGLVLDTSTLGQVNLIVSGSAGRLTWTSAQSTVWDIGAALNWVNTATTLADAFYQADSVLLDDTASGFTLDIAAGAAVAPSVITNNTANSYTINGPGRISGGASIVKRGDGTLSIASSNDFTGLVHVEQGVLQTAHNNALGAADAGTIISSGATLDVGNPTAAANAVNLGVEPFTVSGTGFGGAGAIVNNTALAQQNAVRIATLVGDTTFGGNGRWDFRGAGAALSTGGNAYKITKVGANQVTLVGVTVDPALGDIDVQQGIFSIETTSTAGDPTKTITVQPGTTLQTFNLAPPLNKRIAFNNASFNNDSGTTVIIGPITLDGECTFDVDGGTSLTLSSTVSGLAGSLTKIETGTLMLSGAISYGGDTTVNVGTLALLGSSSLANSPHIVLGGSAILDVSARTDGTLTIPANRTLFGNGRINGSLQVNAGGTVSPGNDLLGVPIGALVVTNVVTLSGTNVMQTDKSSLTNDVIQGAASIAFGGRLVISDVSAVAFADGDVFKLFDAGSYSGSFTIEPATPGAGLFWDASELTSSGALKVVSTPPPPVPPVIASVTRNGNNLVLGGSGGTPNGPYTVLTSTNLALPLASWTVTGTANFDDAGNCSFSALAEPATSQRFYLLRVP